MPQGRGPLPQLAGDPFITDAGLETVLIFHDGFDLPCFASFPLVDDAAGRAALRRYCDAYVSIAREQGVGLALDTPTWRANTEWGAQLGYSAAALEDVNRRAVALLEEVRDDAGDDVVVVISAAVGPRGDAYRPEALMSPDEARRYHRPQLAALAEAGADLATALTLTYAAEAAGIVLAAAETGLPAVVSFTLETDGRLPDGTELHDAIARVDDETDGAAAYFMVNCAHPTHFEHVLAHDVIRDRVRGVRANASTKSHAELDESEELDAGDPEQLAADYVRLRSALPNMNVVGGCCGTDHRHVAAMCAAVFRES